VASLVPGASDLLLGMGAGDHLVAVSNYDVGRDETRGLPRVGDYQQIDWEQIALLKPDVLIVFMAAERMPPALRDRAEQLSIRLVNIRTERLEDVFDELAKLGEVVNERAKAAEAAGKLRGQLDAVRKRVEGRPAVPTLMVREKSADAVVGRGNFLDDVLEIAGGENVIKAGGWPAIDRETLLSLRPAAVLVLLPDASPQVVQEAARVWQAMPQGAGTEKRRVHILTEWWVVQPGMHLGELAQRFADLLHPAARSGPKP
jgi:iron complex transport system substrate-binding protein